MTRKELTALNDSVKPLTARQLDIVISRGQMTPEECAMHPRTIIGYNELKGVAATQSYRGYALVRYYHVHSTARKGKLAETSADEVMRIFYREDGLRYIFARPVRPMAWVCDNYYYDRPMALKKEPMPYTREEARINVSFDNVIFSMPRHLSMRGYCKKVDTDVIRALYTQRGETLCKQGQFRMLAYSAYHDISDDLMTAMRICHRNHYIVDDPRQYDDYIHQLIRLGLDIHNAHYVCPADLDAAHQEAQRRINNQYRRVHGIAEKRRADYTKSTPKQEKAYQRLVGTYLNVMLQGKGFTIRPLQSVQDFISEWRAMHHCVYTNDYYKKEGCLILSARDDKGARLATIEIDLRNGRIVQCRGKYNSVPSNKLAICNLIKRHMNQIIHPQPIQKVA